MRSHPIKAVRRSRQESGFALIIAVVILVLVSSVVVNLIDYSSIELQSSGRSRVAMKSLLAADSGIQLSLQRIQLPRDMTAFNYTLTDGTVVQSRRRVDPGPQPIGKVGNGPPPDGYEIGVGSGYVNELFLLNVTAQQAVGAGSTELEAMLASLQPNEGA